MSPGKPPAKKSLSAKSLGAKSLGAKPLSAKSLSTKSLGAKSLARKPAPASASIATAQKLLQRAALAYPGAWEDHPWGETVVKVRKKIFTFIGVSDGELHLTAKLPRSGEAALSMFGFARPTPYNLGKSGWVSAAFPRGKQVPVAMLLEWLDESYRAVAPATLVKTLPPL